MKAKVDKKMKKFAVFILIFLFLGNGLPLNNGRTEDAVLATRNILVAGFEPFGENSVNPSMLVAQELDGIKIENATIHSAVLPVIYYKSADILIEKMEEISPDSIICLGLDNFSSSIKVEKIAVNIISSLYPDNDGNIIIFRPITFGPFFLFSNLPVIEITKKMESANISTRPSFFAGTFVCNQVFYEALLWGIGKPVKIGFIHLPNIPSQNPKGMELEDMVEAVKITIAISLKPYN